MQRIAVATWKGGPRAGKGSITTASHVIESAPFAFTSSVPHEASTSPCEMLAAAHASCLSLAIAAELTQMERVPQSVIAEAVYTMEENKGKWEIVSAHLDVVVRVAEIGGRELHEIVQSAEASCPITKALNPAIKRTLDVRLEPAWSLASAGVV